MNSSTSFSALDTVGVQEGCSPVVLNQGRFCPTRGQLVMPGGMFGCHS